MPKWPPPVAERRPGGPAGWLRGLFRRPRGPFRVAKGAPYGWLTGRPAGAPLGGQGASLGGPGTHPGGQGGPSDGQEPIGWLSGSQVPPLGGSGGLFGQPRSPSGCQRGAYGWLKDDPGGRHGMVQGASSGDPGGPFERPREALRLAKWAPYGCLTGRPGAPLGGQGASSGGPGDPFHGGPFGPRGAPTGGSGGLFRWLRVLTGWLRRPLRAA